MQMLNRAIEDASDFRDLMRKLEQGAEEQRQRAWKLERQPGENREQHRARLRREAKAAKAR
jgi:predicted FMN-binding regulatory protein PaiB